MLIALLVVPIVSLLFGITNYVDKYLVSKISENGDYKGLIIFSSLIAGIILLPISLFLTKLNIAIGFGDFVNMFFAATSYLIATVFYFKALNKNDASIVVAMFQLIPVFSYFLGLIFLKEVLSLKQIVGGLIVIISSVVITFDFNDKKFDKTKTKALLIMFCSSFTYSIYFLLFRLTTIDVNFNVATFWYQIGLLLNGLILMAFFKKYRKSFTDLVRKNGKVVFSFNILNEALNLIANVLVNFAITIAPMALVLTLNGLQPFFVFLIGVGLTLTFPKLFNEDISKKSVVQKTLCIICSIIGLSILYF